MNSKDNLEYFYIEAKENTQVDKITKFFANRK